MCENKFHNPDGTGNKKDFREEIYETTEDIFSHYMQSKKNNAKVIVDKEQYLKIVKLNDEYHDHIQNFQPKVGSQLDQVVLYLISQNLETYNLSVKLSWSQIQNDPKDYPWISIRYFLIHSKIISNLNCM